jgi:S-adenosyl methyltransferase
MKGMVAVTLGPDAGWNIARVYDYLLGGNHNAAADREAAGCMLAAYPGLRDLIGENRRFVTAAVQRGCSPRADGGEEMAQVIDLGCGLPVSPAGFPWVHEAARVVRPGVTVAYVDNDPLVNAFARGLAGPGTAAVLADLRDPGAVPDSPALLSVIDPGRPVLLLAAAVLHFMSPGEAAKVLADYRERLAPGSLIAVSVAHFEDEGILAAVLEAGGEPGDFRSYSRDEAGALLDGTVILPPGVRAARRWMAGLEEGDPAGTPAWVLCGMGRVP